MIFISYTSMDKNDAFSLVEHLERNGETCWIAPRDVVAGMSFPAQILQAIRNSTGFVLVASHHTNQSKHVISEVGSAFDCNIKIYPFLIEPVHFNDDYLYYLRQMHWINGYDNYEAACQELLRVIYSTTDRTALVNKQADDKGKIITRKKTRIAHYQDLLALGMDALSIARRLVDNDKRLYPEINDLNEGSAELWAQYLSSYPDTFRYLLNEKDEIIGNWSFLAVSEELHLQKLRAGELQEATFSIDETEFLLFPGDYIGYLLNLSLNDGYMTSENLKLLIVEFIAQLKSFAHEGIFFKSWFVNVFRKDHESMYRGLGFSYFLDNKTYGKLYKIDCTPFPSKSPFSRNAELKELYHEHYQ